MGSLEGECMKIALFKLFGPCYVEELPPNVQHYLLEDKYGKTSMQWTDTWPGAPVKIIEYCDCGYANPYVSMWLPKANV